MKTFVAGVIDWRGPNAPGPADLSGRSVLAQGLVHTGVFTEGGAEILGNAPDTIPDPALTSAFRDFAVGTTTFTWGWKVLPRRVEATLTGTG